jgi:hypothetical protein
MSLFLIAVIVIIVTFLIYFLVYGATNLHWDDCVGSFYLFFMERAPSFFFDLLNRYLPGRFTRNCLG